MQKILFRKKYCYIKMNKKLSEIYRLSLSILFINIIFAFLLLIWVTDKDIHGLPSNILDRYISLFYFGVTTLTTTGYGDIYAKSNRMKLIISMYMILTMTGVVSLLFTF
jgi:hypothetical protein